MEKKKCLMVIMGLILILLVGCKSAGDNEVVIIDAETGEEIIMKQEELEAKEQELIDYSQHLSEVFEKSLSLQNTFAHALDDMFTKEASASQFATIIKDHIIDESREILDKGENYNFPTDYFEMNQMVVENLNHQHQLFLDAVDEATIAALTEEQQIDIVQLRERLANIKQDYLAIVNAWKNGGKVD